MNLIEDVLPSCPKSVKYKKRDNLKRNYSSLKSQIVKIFKNELTSQTLGILQDRTQEEEKDHRGQILPNDI